MVLAGGDGIRMRSTRPKPLQVLCGKAMVLYQLDTLHALGVSSTTVVVGLGAERVTKKLQDEGPAMSLDFVEQRFARGTGDAAGVGAASFDYDDGDDAVVLVLPSDMPLVRAATLQGLVDEHRSSGAAVTLLTAHLDDPSEMSRVVRNQSGGVASVVLPNDPHGVLPITNEVNAGIYCFGRNLLSAALRRVLPRRATGMTVLSDVVEVLARSGNPVSTYEATDHTEIYGVKDRVQLARVEAELRRRTNLAWLQAGVTLVDPDHTYIDTTVRIGADVTVFPGTTLSGRTVIGEGADIGPNSRLVDCAVGDGAHVESTVASDAEIGPRAVVGPFAVLQPGDSIAAGERTGAFFAPRTRDN